MGLPAYMLAADDRYSTVYRAPQLGSGEVPMDIPGERVDLRFVPFADRTMPENRQVSARTIDAVTRRLLAVSSLSVRIMFDRAARKVDLVHIHSPMWAAIAAFSKVARISTVITIHGTDFRRLSESALLRRLLIPIDRILCVSDRFTAELTALFPGKPVETVYNGVDTRLFSPASTPSAGRRRQIVSVGSFRWHKDHLSLIRAFAELAGEYPEWSLVLVGEGDLRSDLEQAVAELGLRQRVRFTGALSHDDLAKELAASEVFALSSVTEGLPKVLLEAMASGCACLATDVGECRAVMAGTGLVVGPRDTASLADALRSLVSSPDTRKALGARAVERAQAFTWRAYRDRHFKIYRSLLGSGG